MSSHIYNEGRVVGYSAYEIYVRHSLSEDPNRTPATETEWLASSIACGSSMVLKIPVDNHAGDHFIEVNLPSDSRLAAANTIIGSLFLGDAEVDSAGWARKITSYGSNLIQNSGTSPSGDTVEPNINVNNNELSSTARQQILNYVKIVDGIVIQPGNWKDSSSGTPPKDLSPAINRVPRVRIQLSDKVTTAFYVLLTGFTIRTVLAGISGLDGSTDTNTNTPEDGGFLGPAIFPWANKIVFSVPASYVSYFTDSNYYRKMSTHGNPSSMETEEKRVYRLPVIDMETTNPQNYYSSQDSDSRVPLDVTGWNKINGDAVLTVYQRSAAFPPALFGTKVIKAGTHDPYIHPLDTVAPGTLKLFNSDDRNASFEKSKTFQSNIPHNYAFHRDTHDFVVRQVDDTAETTENWAELPVALTYVDSIYGALEGSEVIPPYFIEQTNNGDPENFAAPSTMYTRRIRGKVSDNFKVDFGIDPADTTQYNFLRMAMQSINRADDPGKSDIRINRSMYNYITSDSNWKTSYFFILQGSITFTSNSVNELKLVPVLKPKSNDIVPSNVFDYIYKTYGPKFKIPVVLPTTTTEADRTGSFGQYVGGYWQYISGTGEGPTNNQSILEYLENVVGENVVALQDYNRKVPTVNGYTDWRDAYSAITVENFVKAVIEDAVNRNAIPPSVTYQSVLNNGYDYTYTDSHGNSRIVQFQPIASQYRNLTLSQAFEKAKFYDLSSSSTTPLSSGGLVFSVNYAYISNLHIKVKQSSSNGMTTTDKPYTLFNAPDWEIDWDDEDSLMVRIDSATAPSDWSTRFRHFYKLSGTSYEKVLGDSAPTWETGKYYRPKYELIEVYYDKSLTLTTTVPDENSPKYTAMEWPTQEAQLRYSFSDGPLAATTITGRKQTRSLSVADKSGKIYRMAGDGGVINNTKDGNIHWDDLLNALISNKAIDILGSNRFYTMLVSRLAYGYGIQFSSDIASKLLTIGADLVRGPGISISNFSGQDPYDPDVTHSKGKQISLNISAGNGISVVPNPNTGSITITNISPYPGAAVGFKTVDRSFYELKLYNNFRSINTDAFGALPDDDQTQANLSHYVFGSDLTSHRLTIQLLPVIAEDGETIEQCYIRVSGSGKGESSAGDASVTYHLGCLGFSNSKFELAHSSTVDQRPLSKICSFKFKSGMQWNYKGHNLDLSQLNSKDLQDNGQYGNMIWNLTSDEVTKFRGSWDVICPMDKTDDLTSESAGRTIIHAGSISDGYNKQIYDLAKIEGVVDPSPDNDPARFVYTDWINLFIQGMYY